MSTVSQIGIKLTVDAQSVTTEVPKAAREFDALGNRAEAASARTTRSLADVNMSVRSIVAGAAGLHVVSAALSAITNAAMAMPRNAFDFSKNLEVSQIGMAGILGSMTAMGGHQTDYNTALAISRDMIGKLNDDALRTAASSQELTTVFQALLAPGLSAKMTLDEIRQLTVVGINAVKSMGLESTQIVQELRDLVAGGITPASSTLASALGLKDSDIAAAKASSEGLFSFLMARMKGFEASSEAFGDTLKGKLDQVKEGATRVAAEGMEPLVVAAKQALTEVGALFTTIEAGGKVTLNKELVAGMREYATSAAAAMQTGTQWAAALWESRDAAYALGVAWASVKVGGVVADTWAAVAAQVQLTQASRLAGAQAAAEAAGNQAVAATAAQKLAAYMAELQAKVASAQADVAAQAAQLATLATTREAIVLSRAEVVAKLEATRATMAQAEAQIAAARAAGAQSMALALLREGTQALTVAQARHAVLTTELATLGKQQAGVQAAITAATVAQTAATNAATAASGGLAAAQTAASVAGRVMTGALGLLGGPVGAITTALMLGVTAWLTWGDSAGKAEKKVSGDVQRSTAEIVGDLNQQIAKLRERNALAAAGMPEVAKQSTDSAARLAQLQGQINNLQAGKGLNGGAPLPEAARVGLLQTLLRQYGELTGSLQTLDAEQAKLNGGTGKLTLTLTGAEQAWRKVSDGAKTASAAQQEYDTKLAAGRQAWAQYKDALVASGASAATIKTRQAEQDQVEKALATERDKKIKELGAGAVTAQNHVVDAQIAAAAQGYKRLAAQTADGLDALDSLRQQDIISEGDHIAQRAALQRADLDAQAAMVSQKLALERKKKDSGKEQATLTGQLAELAQKRANVETKATRDLEEANARLLKVLDDQAAAAQNAAQQAQDRVRTAQAETQEIGITGAALGQLRQARVDEAAAQLEAKARTLETIDLSGRTSAALREQAQAMRELASVTATNEARRAVADYALAVRDSADAIEYEQGLAALSQRDRAIALEQYRIEIDLRKRLADIDAKTTGDPALRAQLRSDTTDSAARAKASAVAKVQMSEWQRSVEQYDDVFRKGFADMVAHGEGAWKSFTASLATTFKTTVADQLYKAFAQPFVVNVVGNVLGLMGLGGAGGAGGAGANALTGAASSAAGSALVSGASLTSMGQYFATGFMNTAVGTGAATGAGAGAAIGGANGAAMQVGAYAPYAAAAVAALAALGAFRTTKTVGGGLTGTLGEGDINAYDLRRKSGYLFGGPDYSTQDKGVAAQSAALQTAFSSAKNAAIQVADAFGLGSEGVANFTTQLGSDLIHPDTGGYGIKLDGLTEQQAQEKIAAALAAANDAIAAEILGIKTITVDTVKKTVVEVGTAWDDGYQTITRDVEEQVTTTTVSIRKDLLPWMQRIADANGPTAKTLQTIAEYPDKLLQVAGTSRDALVTTFAQGLMTGDAATAGQSVANQLVASIEQSLVGNAAGQIFDIVNRGIVTPMIDAMLTGQSVSEAMSAASIDAVIAKATAAAEVIGQVLNDPTFKAAMDGLRASVGSALGAAGASLAYVPQYQPAAPAAPAAANAATGLGQAVDDLAKKFKDAQQSLAETHRDLVIDLARAQGDEAGARAMEREKHLSGYLDLTQAERDLLGARYDENTRLKDQLAELGKLNDLRDTERQLRIDEATAFGDTAKALELMTEGMGEAEKALFLSNRSISENNAAQLRVNSLKDDERSLTIDLLRAQGDTAGATALLTEKMGEAERAQYLLNEGLRQQIATLNERHGIETSLLTALHATGQLRERELAALSPANRALQQLAYALADVQTAADKATAGVNASYAQLDAAITLQKSVLAQRLEDDKKALADQADAAQKAVTDVKGIFDAIKSAIKSTTVESDALSRAARASAMATLQGALATAQAGGRVDAIAGLEDALTTMAKPSEQLYARFGDYARAQDASADVMRQLGEQAGGQLSVAELTLKATKGAATALDDAYQLQIKALDSTLEQWKTSIAIQQGTYLAVLDIPAAIAGLAASFNAAKAPVAAAQSVAAGSLSTYQPGQVVQLPPALGGMQASFAAVETPAAPAQPVAAAQSVAAGSLSAYAPGQVVGAVDYVRQAAASGDVMAIYQGAANVGMNADQVAAVIALAGYNDVGADDVRAWVSASGLAALPEAPKKFAAGGAFTNGVVQRPTYFDAAQMGEAGPEAIVPLANINGRLGIASSGGLDAGRIVNAIERLYALLDTIAAASGATAQHAYNTQRAAWELADRGVKVLPAQNQPLITVAVAVPA